MTKVLLMLDLIFSVVQSEREVDAGFVAYHSRRTAMSSSVRPRPDCSFASSMSMSHLRIRSLPGSLRARTASRAGSLKMRFVLFVRTEQSYRLLLSRHRRFAGAWIATFRSIHDRS